MNHLRPQKKGNQKPWSKEELKAGLEHFYVQYKHYPSAPEIDGYSYLPSARTIERSFGGVVKIRKLLRLNGQHDLRTGVHSSERALKIKKRSHTIEHEVYEFLIKIFGKEFVHREYFFLDDKRTRADFFVYDEGNGFCVDVFYPSDKRNLLGCLNSKLAKYNCIYMQQYPVIFLQMNKDIDQGSLNKILKNKINKLSKHQELMSWETFESFCRKRKPLHLK
jgi:hypothetical protein